jgi:AcrR family transcriptional regulator
MAEKVKASRRYHSPLRADQAERTRGRVLDAALELFAERGYAGTTVAAIADRARVSAQTVYVSLGGKRGVLESLIESAIAGAGDPASADEQWSTEVASLSDARERLARLVEHSCGILARTRPIHAVIRGAADKEAFAATLGRRLLQDRLAAQTERIRTHLRDDLRPGMTVIEAGQRYCALASPDLYHLLVSELGWTPAQHRKWLTQLLEAELLGPGAARPDPD